MNIYILSIYIFYIKTKSKNYNKNNTIFYKKFLIPILIRSYIEVYNFRNITTLSKLKNLNYIIKLKRNNPLYSLIYNLSNREFSKLRNYLDNTIEKD